MSQTWREASISDTKFYFANVFSSIVGCIYIFLIQIIFAFLYLFDSNYICFLNTVSKYEFNECGNK
ncbi:MAG TPA: hypothetical protein DG851_00325 [Lactobacillus acetotolerans]|nr:hypothetical protein [Lactobacillus acetotolerans]